MKSAIERAHSVHQQFVDTAFPRDGTVVTTISGDLAWPSNVAHQYQAVARHTGKSTVIDERIELIVSGLHASWRPGRLSWNCERLVAGTRVQNGLLALEAKAITMLDARQITWHNTRVWRVRARGSVALLGSGRPALEFLLSTKTMLPLQVTSIAPTSDNIPAGKSVETYSKWGEKVKVTLPKQCK